MNESNNVTLSEVEKYSIVPAPTKFKSNLWKFYKVYAAIHKQYVAI